MRPSRPAVSALLLLAVLLLSSSRISAWAPPQGRPVEFPSYDSVPGLAPYGSREAYAAAVADHRFVMEQVPYTSDGLPVLAYVYRPVTSTGRLPVIVFNRGSWTWEFFHPHLVVMAHRLAEAGYAVVAPMYRGSGGSPGRDEMGGADL